MLKDKFVTEPPEVMDPFRVFGVRRWGPLFLGDPWREYSRAIDLPVVGPDAVEGDEESEAPDRGWDECGEDGGQ